MKSKIGLLLPRTVLYPSISFDLREGMRAGLETNQAHEFTVVTDNIGMAANDVQIYDICERMLMDDVQIIAGYVNPNTAAKLQPLFAGANALFICLDTGYQFMPPETPLLSNVIFVSLLGTLCCRMTAGLALKAGHETFAFSTSFLDAGYRPAYAYDRAIHNDGGRVIFNHVGALKKVDFTLQPLMNLLRDEPEHAVIAAYCGDMTVDFCSHMAESETTAQHIYAAPFMLEETWLDKTPYPGADMQGTTTWFHDLNLPANEDFKKAILAKGRTPNIFSMLAYEAGQLITAIMDQGFTGDKAVTALHGYQFESPRGTVTIDPATQHTLSPVYHVAAIKNETDGFCKLSLQSVAEGVPQQWTLLQEDILNLTSQTSNWLNVYPCIES